MKRAPPQWLLALGGSCALSLPAGILAQESTVRFSPAQSAYLEGCGGCHGIQGRAPHTSIPELRGFVGWFLCTEEGREYIVRLPNVSFAAVDDASLADMMNFVVFGLGGDSVPQGVAPYTADEIGALRRRPLKNAPLAQIRSRILAKAMARCEIRQGRASVRPKE